AGQTWVLTRRGVPVEHLNHVAEHSGVLPEEVRVEGFLRSADGVRLLLILREVLDELQDLGDVGRAHPAQAEACRGLKERVCARAACFRTHAPHLRSPRPSLVVHKEKPAATYKR